MEVAASLNVLVVVATKTHEVDLWRTLSSTDPSLIAKLIWWWQLRTLITHLLALGSITGINHVDLGEISLELLDALLSILLDHVIVLFELCFLAHLVVIRVLMEALSRSIIINKLMRVLWCLIVDQATIVHITLHLLHVLFAGNLVATANLR